MCDTWYIAVVDACVTNPCVYGTCQNVAGTTACNCYSGALGLNCDKSKYDDAKCVACHHTYIKYM